MATGALRQHARVVAVSGASSTARRARRARARARRSRSSSSTSATSPTSASVWARRPSTSGSPTSPSSSSSSRPRSPRPEEGSLASRAGRTLWIPAPLSSSWLAFQTFRPASLDDALFDDHLVSYLKLVEYALLAVAVPLLVRARRDLTIVLGALVLWAAVAVGVGAAAVLRRRHLRRVEPPAGASRRFSAITISLRCRRSPRARRGGDRHASPRDLPARALFPWRWSRGPRPRPRRLRRGRRRSRARQRRRSGSPRERASPRGKRETLALVARRRSRGRRRHGGPRRCARGLPPLRRSPRRQPAGRRRVLLAAHRPRLHRPEDLRATSRRRRRLAALVARRTSSSRTSTTRASASPTSSTSRSRRKVASGASRTSTSRCSRTPGVDRARVAAARRSVGGLALAWRAAARAPTPWAVGRRPPRRLRAPHPRRRVGVARHRRRDPAAGGDVSPPRARGRRCGDGEEASG